MSINVSYILDQLSDFSDGSNIRCTEQQMRELLLEKSNFKNKRTKCSYFVWLDEHRNKIKKEHFSDFDNVSNWSLENKMNYYKSKGLPTDKVVKEGRPRIVSLITTMAGIIWKSLSDEERSVYEDKAQLLKDNSTPVVIEQKPKRKRGRPKKNSTTNTVVEAVVEQFKDKEDDDEIQVEEIKFRGKIYYLDINSNDIYDPDTSELVGKKVNDIININ